MHCPHCQSLKNSVVDSRLTDSNTAIRRRRHCDECDGRFTTFERLRAANIMVIKKDQTREEYDREKLERGIFRACVKRPVKKEDIGIMLSRLEEKWAASSEITSMQIGEDVMQGLKELDPIAFIRFASVYHQFSDVKDFEEMAQQAFRSGISVSIEEPQEDAPSGLSAPSGHGAAEGGERGARA